MLQTVTLLYCYFNSEMLKYYGFHRCMLLVYVSSGNKRYTFEASHQMLTSIGTTRLTLVAHCSLFTVKSLLLTALCLQFYVVHCLMSKMGHACLV